ncbi:unnamed protein product [Pylaiella littoralis]
MEAPSSVPAGAEAVGMKKLLGTYFICEMRVPVAKLIKTSIGRELRSAGVNHLKECIERDGFLEQFAPVVSLMKPLSDGESLEDVMPVEGFKLKIIDGNHRVKALELIDGEKGTATSINCRVHGVMSPSAERMVAAGFNRVSSSVVETLLIDDVVWYRAVIAAIQQAHTGQNLTEKQLQNKVKQEYSNQSLSPPAPATLKKWICLSLKITDLGLDAMKDVSYLPGRGPKHPDHKVLDHKRVTLKMLCRERFHDMNPYEQEVYVFRLAKGSITSHKILSEEECGMLDKTAVNVGLEVERLEAIVPRAGWSSDLRE